MGLRVEVLKKDQGVFVVSLTGSLDSGTYAELDKKIEPLLRPLTKGVICDLKDLDYISSMGIGVLLKIKSWMKEHGGDFLLVNVPAPINEVFATIKALPDVPVFANIEEADRYFAAIQKRVKEENETKN